MKVWMMMAWNEIKLARAGIAVHMIGVFQPALMYFLMTLVLVNPTFDVNVLDPVDPDTEPMLEAMQKVGVQSGVPYINIECQTDPDRTPGGQIIRLEELDGRIKAVQVFQMIDSNMVKNYRNRLTAAGLILWSDMLGNRAVTIVEKPLLPADMPYDLYFGMGMIPLAAFLAAIMAGSAMITKDYELETVLEYRLSPRGNVSVLSVRLLRSALFGLMGAGVMVLMIWLLTGFTPGSMVPVALIIFPICLIGASLGMAIGLAVRSPLPAFVVSLAVSFVCWLMGGAFGLPAGFNPIYERISRILPNTYAVERLFPLYYGVEIGNEGLSIMVLLVQSVFAVLLVWWVQKRMVELPGRRNHG